MSSGLWLVRLLQCAGSFLGWRRRSRGLENRPMPSNFKKLVEARMKKTGESWQTASRRVRDERSQHVASAPTASTKPPLTTSRRVTKRMLGFVHDRGWSSEDLLFHVREFSLWRLAEMSADRRHSALNGQLDDVLGILVELNLTSKLEHYLEWDVVMQSTLATRAMNELAHSMHWTFEVFLRKAEGYLQRRGVRTEPKTVDEALKLIADHGLMADFEKDLRGQAVDEFGSDYDDGNWDGASYDSD